MNLNAPEQCDIIIPVWNNLEMTRDCVNSIKKHTTYPYRIIIVDNASDEPTRQYLDSLKEKNSTKVDIIRNEKNKGFVKAVNQGMRYSDAAYVCIMNNDTVATDGWLKELIEILRENNDIGIINPSSNTSCQFPGKLGIDEFARTLKILKGKYQELYTCRAFSMVVKREVIEKIGYLDENYGVGYFDDTDYCKRVQKSGYKTVRAKASYVYHKESQSFSKVREKNEIFLENEKKFVAKWGRQLRVAYVLPELGPQSEIDKVSSGINRIAKIGHQVWIFTKSKLKPKLDLIDHENIRFYCYPAVFLDVTIFYKIWKRKRKKKLHVILTNNRRLFNVFGFFRDLLDAETFADSDYSFIEKKLGGMAGSYDSI